MNLDRVNEIIDHYGVERTSTLAILQDIQREYSYLPREALELTAERLSMPAGEIYGLATFFKAFSLQPKGEYVCKVCLGTACHVAGGDIILENFERKLGITDGETTADREYSVERVACVGCCALAPVAVVDDAVEGHMLPSRVEGIFVQFQIEREREAREEAERGSGE